jgi:lipopolysaccharide transport system ATP-binding protein
MTLISVQGVTKRFPVIAPPDPASWSARHSLFRAGRATGETFAALDDVSLEVRAGEVIAILGRNGAGKSTLLKILSRIIRPDRGRIVLRGRVGSLLEVGTGFHPDLTGRENVFLNAAILGLTEQEIRARFDAIVDFAEVEHALDTPVSHYSTGMYMRLAFAVAVHVNPEILFVDEVLSVGDAAFQRKCLQRLERLGREGQAVLFVSHNLAAVSRLCNRAVLLERGRLIRDGSVSEVIAAYVGQEGGRAGDRTWAADEDAPGDEIVRLHRVCIRGPRQDIRTTLTVDEPFDIELDYQVRSNGVVLFPSVTLVNEWDVPVLWTTDLSTADHGRPRRAGHYRARVRVPAHLLPDGMLRVSVTMASFGPPREHIRENDAVRLVLVDAADGTTARGLYPGQIASTVRPRLDWTVTDASSLSGSPTP